MNIRTTSLNAILLSSLAAGSAHAAANLQITELWAGGLSGSENTSDWFELTNFGDTAATGLDGNLYYDDNSDDPTVNDPMTGIDTIAPGESVIYLASWEDDYSTLSAAIADFVAMWGAPNGALSSVQIGGVIGGSGLSGGGDAVNVFDGNTAGATTLDRESYSSSMLASWVSDASGNWNDDLAQVGVLGGYEGNLDATSSNGAPPIGSPGAVPEPTSLALLSLGGLAMLRRRR